MAIIYNAAVKTARITATRDYFADGTLEILTAADAVLVTFGLDADAGTLSGDTWTLEFDATSVAASGTGIAAKAQVKNSVGDAHLTGLTVGTSGADVIISNTSINSSQTISVTSAAIQHAA